MLLDVVEPARVSPAISADDMAEILSLVRARCGVDFSGYRSGTLERRVRTAMITAGAGTSAAFLVRLRADDGALAALQERLTVKVSRFFRDAEAVEQVRRALWTRATGKCEPLALWSAGCGRGEEPYTLAMLLAEADAPSATGGDVLATDVDPLALAAAEAGAYPAVVVEGVPPELRERYFEEPDARGNRKVGAALRQRVQFRCHDLTAAEDPIALFDLVACRNTLIYFQPQLQRRVLALLWRSVAPGGLLWLGEAEWPTGCAGAALTVVDRKARLFRKGEVSPRA